MSFTNRTHTAETKRKMSEAQKKRYSRETEQQREHRIQAHKDWYKNANKLIQEDAEKAQYEAHKEFVLREYERLKNMGEI